VGGGIARATGGDFTTGALNAGIQAAFNDNRDLWYRVRRFVGYGGGRAVDDFIGTATQGAYAAQAGMSGYLNRLTFGFSSPEGWDVYDPESYATGQQIGTSTLIAEGAVVVAHSGPALYAAGAKVWSDLHFDGPQRGSRIAQVRYGNMPLVRLDYGRYQGSGGAPRLHLNIGPSISDQVKTISICP
jgi:hypothetical protein